MNITTARRRHRSTRSFPGLGSVSTATLRTEDLLSSFGWTLKCHGGRTGKRLAREADNLPSADDWTLEQAEDADCTLQEMTEELESLAPDYVHFGAHEGDGADFGFWVSWDALEDDCRGRNPEVRKVSNLGDVPKAYRGYVLEVNDHGNATLYLKTARTFRQLWAAV